MRRSRLIALGYVVAGVLFIVNAVSGAATDTERRAVTWGVLGAIWLLFSGYAVLMPKKFDTGKESEWKTKTETKTETGSVAGYTLMFTAVLILLLVLGVGVLLNLVF